MGAWLQNKWTAARIERLRKLQAMGLSCSQIAADLGGITRNAVIGKCHRLGLVSQSKQARKEPVEKKPRPKKAVVVKPGKSFVSLPSSPVIMPAATSANPVALLDLKRHHCRYPVGTEEPAKLFCGDPRVAPYSYCVRHCLVCFSLINRGQRSIWWNWNRKAA